MMYEDGFNIEEWKAKKLAERQETFAAQEEALKDVFGQRGRPLPTTLPTRQAGQSHHCREYGTDPARQPAGLRGYVGRRLEQVRTARQQGLHGDRADRAQQWILCRCQGV